MKDNQHQSLAMEPWGLIVIGFFLTGVGVLLNLRPIFQLLEKILVNGLHSGLATLIGAIIGFSAIAWQTKAGFRNLSRSQANQAKLDREARDHQNELVAKKEKLDSRKDTVSLAAVLYGEISSGVDFTRNSISVCKTMIEYFESLGEKIIDYDVSTNDYNIMIKKDIFNKNVENFRLLKPDLIRDIIKVYYNEEITSKKFKNEGLPAKEVAENLRSHLGLIEGWVWFAERTIRELNHIIVSYEHHYNKK